MNAFPQLIATHNIYYTYTYRQGGAFQFALLRFILHSFHSAFKLPRWKKKKTHSSSSLADVLINKSPVWLLVGILSSKGAAAITWESHAICRLGHVDRRFFSAFPDSRSIEPFRPDSLPFLLLLSPHRPRSAQWRRGGNISFIADIIPPDKKKKNICSS